MRKYVYADNAATTKLDKVAYDAMLPFLLEEYSNASQPYAFARRPKKALQEAREIIASCIGACPEEIYFTSGGTESDNWAIKSISVNDDKKKGIITSSIEHHAVLHSCETLEKIGYPVVYIHPSKDGVISSKALSQVITNHTRLTSIMYANNEIGTIQSIKELCKIAHQKGSLFHTDAVQAVGHVEIDVRDLGVDLLSASAHKFNGMKGVGFLYIRKGCNLFPYIDGGSQEFGLRAGTENIAGIVCMASALKNNCDKIRDNKKKVCELENLLLNYLSEAGVYFIRNGGNHTLPGLISLSFPGKNGEAILHRMDLMGFCISTGSACNSKKMEISHVLQAIKLDEKFAKGTVRVSLGKNNTYDETIAIGKALAKILA